MNAIFARICGRSLRLID